MGWKNTFQIIHFCRFNNQYGAPYDSYGSNNLYQSWRLAVASYTDQFLSSYHSRLYSLCVTKTDSGAFPDTPHSPLPRSASNTFKGFSEPNLTENLWRLAHNSSDTPCFPSKGCIFNTLYWVFPITHLMCEISKLFPFTYLNWTLAANS